MAKSWLKNDEYPVLCLKKWAEKKSQNSGIIFLVFLNIFFTFSICQLKKKISIPIHLNWLNMKHRRIKHGLTMIYKILNGLAPNYLRDNFTLTSEIHNINTRRAGNTIFINKNITSKIHRKSYSFYMARIYNSLPENIQKSVSVNAFKLSITKYIKSGNLVLPTS